MALSLVAACATTAPGAGGGAPPQGPASVPSATTPLVTTIQKPVATNTPSVVAAPTMVATPSISPHAPYPTPGRTITLADNGTQVQLPVGYIVNVALPAPPGYANWVMGPPTNESVLEPTVNPAAAAVRGMTLAAYRVVGTGQAIVNATAAAECPSGQACPQTVRLFRVTVVVQGVLGWSALIGHGFR